MFSEHRFPPRVATFVLPLAIALLAASTSFCLAAGPQAATGGVMGRMVSLPERGSGLYSWALPVTLSGLLKEAQVETLSTDDLAAVLKSQGLADLSQGLPKEWGPAALKAAAQAGSTGASPGYVLIASWNTRVPQNQWGETTEFWLKARLLKGDAVVFDSTRLPPEDAKYYHLAEYDVAVRNLAEMVLKTVNPAELDRAHTRQVWTQHLTMTQVHLLAEAEEDVARDDLLAARAKLVEAHLAVQGREGSLVAFRRLIEVSEALRARDPQQGRRLGQEMEVEGRRNKAEDRKQYAWDCLYEGEGFRLQDKWQDAAPDYFEWVKYLVRQKRLQPDEIFPEAVRADLPLEEPDVWSHLQGPAAEAQWWATVAVAVYRGVSGALAEPFFERALACAGLVTDPAARGAALVIVAGQQQSAYDFDAAEKQYLAALKILEAVDKHCDPCAAAYDGLGRIADARGNADDALKWLNKALDIRKSNPESRQWASTANDLAVAQLHVHHVDLALTLSSNARSTLERIAPASLDLARVYTTIGEVQMERGQAGEAEKLFDLALPIVATIAPGSPEFARVANNLGDVFLGKGDRGKAAEFYSQALDNTGFPPGPLSRERRPDLFAETSVTPERTAKQQTLPDEAATPPALQNISGTTASMGFEELLNDRYGEALRVFKRASNQAPDSPRARSGLAWSYVALKHLVEAATTIDEVCAFGRKALVGLIGDTQERLAKKLLDQDNPAGYYTLGRFWEAMGEADKAADAYKTFLDRAPADHIFRADATARLAHVRPK